MTVSAPARVHSEPISVQQHRRPTASQDSPAPSATSSRVQSMSLPGAAPDETLCKLYASYNDVDTEEPVDALGYIHAYSMHSAAPVDVDAQRLVADGSAISGSPASAPGLGEKRFINGSVLNSRWQQAVEAWNQAETVSLETVDTVSDLRFALARRRFLLSPATV